MSPGGGLFSAPSHPGSIVSATTFHFRVRDGNGWDRRALTTRTLSIANRRLAGKHGPRSRPWVSPRTRRPPSRLCRPADIRRPHQPVQRCEDAPATAIAEKVRRRGARRAHRGTAGGDRDRPRHYLAARHLLHKRALASVADGRKLHTARPVLPPSLRQTFAGDGLPARRRPRDHRPSAARPSSSTTWKR